MIDYRNKILNHQVLPLWREQMRRQGKTLATLNGSFDLLHAGHLHIISEAAKTADCLLVALNSDASVRSYKGEKRPIIPLTYRMQMMAALGVVTAVTWFEESTPCKLLEIIKPDVHVNGKDWEGKSPEEAIIRSYGGTLVYVPLIPGLSTSEIVKKIVSSYDQSICVSSEQSTPCR